MPSGNAGLLLDLIGSFVGQSTPKLKKGAYTIGPDGQVIVPYDEPGWGTRFFHPNVASYETEANNAASTQQAKAELQNRVSNLIAGQNFEKVKPYQGTSLNSPDLPNEAGGLLTGGNETAQNLLGANEAQAKIAAGIPLSDAQRLVEENKARTRELTAGNTIGNPELMATSDAQKAISTIASLKANAPNIQPQANLEGARIASASSLLGPQTETELQRLGLEQGVMPSRFAAEGGQNLVSLGRSGRELSNAPVLDATSRLSAGNDLLNAGTDSAIASKKNGLSGLIADILGNNLTKEGFASSQMPMSPEPRVASIRDGTVTPGVSNPLFAPVMGTKIEGLGANTKPAIATVNKDGSFIKVPPTAKQYNATGELLGGNGVNIAPTVNSQLDNRVRQVDLEPTKLVEPIHTFDSFLKELKTSPGRKAGNAIVELARQIADNYPITGMKRDDVVDFYYDAMSGKNPKFHYSEILKLLEETGDKEQAAMYGAALKKGGYANH